MIELSDWKREDGSPIDVREMTDDQLDMLMMDDTATCKIRWIPEGLEAHERDTRPGDNLR